MIKEKLRDIINGALRRIDPSCAFTADVESSSQPQFGDYTSTIALTMSRMTKQRPRELALKIQGLMEEESGVIESISVAGPGFLNFKIVPSEWIRSLSDIVEQGDGYGISKEHAGRRALVEFVSANPTGPLHVGHGRNAVVGDTLARLMRAVGFEVDREYYVNDGGVQMATLGRSVLARYQELQGKEVKFPEDGYRGEYIQDLANEKFQIKERFEGWTDSKLIEEFGRDASQKILGEIKDDLREIQVEFENYFYESSLDKDGFVQKTLVDLKEKKLTYENEGALWIRSTNYGDDKDRVLIKSDGSTTYLTPDIAYHQKKYDRGYDRLVNIWGADHAGYVGRLKAALKGLGRDEGSLSIVLIQMVSLIRGGQSLSMSTRKAQYETLRSIVREVGSDVARYFYMMRSWQAQLDFDLDLAKKQTQENPVYYIQYAHARISSVFAKALELSLITDPDIPYRDSYSVNLNLPEEIQLARRMLDYPDLIKKAADDLAPHRVSFYVLDLAREFQSYYDKARVDPRYKFLSEDKERGIAKLFFLSCLRQILKNGLGILGVSAPEAM